MTDFQNMGAWQPGVKRNLSPLMMRAFFSGGRNWTPATPMSTRGDFGLIPFGGTQKTFPPGTSMLPVRPMRMRSALPVWKLLTLMSMPLPHWSAAGFVVAKVLAASRMADAFTRVMGSAHSGVKGWTWAARRSKPKPYFSTNSWSYSSSVTMTLIMARARAHSLPGLSWSQ